MNTHFISTSRALICMAGRSGAAAVEVELREAATRFDAKELAACVHAAAANDDKWREIAAALDSVSAIAPHVERGEGEAFLRFAEAADGASLRRVDCTELVGESLGFGLELLLNGEQLVGVSLYLE